MAKTRRRYWWAAGALLGLLAATGPAGAGPAAAAPDSQAAPAAGVLRYDDLPLPGPGAQFVLDLLRSSPATTVTAARSTV